MISTHTSTIRKKVLLLGSGFVARPCAEYITRNPSNDLTIACRTLTSAEAVAANLPNTTAISLDVANITALEEIVAAHDLVISLIPYTFHTAVVEAAIKCKTNVVTTSYVSAALRGLAQAAKDAGIIVMNEIGLDPGIDHLYAIKTIDEVHEKGGKMRQFMSYCGGLPAPECANNPLGYKFSWSARGVLLALLNDAAYYSENRRVNVLGKDLMAHSKPVSILPGFSLFAYPNRDSTPFREYYNIPEAETVVRENLRYAGFTEHAEVLIKQGWLDTSEKEWLAEGITWAEVTRQVTGASAATESTLIARIEELCNFPTPTEAARIIDGMRWLGLFSSNAVSPRGKNLLDTLCAHLEEMMSYGPGERDMVILQHKFVIEWADGSSEVRTSTLEAYGDPDGHSAMARTVGIPCGIAAQLILDGVIRETGVHAPYTKELCDPIREIVEKEGLGLVEKTIATYDKTPALA